MAATLEKITYFDYAACVRCTQLGSFGTNHEIDYCARDFPFADEPEKVQQLPHKRYMIGCEGFVWNEMPIHRKAQRELSRNPEYATSPLLLLAGEEVICDMTALRVMKEKGYGSSFRK